MTERQLRILAAAVFAAALFACSTDDGGNDDAGFDVDTSTDDVADDEGLSDGDAGDVIDADDAADTTGPPAPVEVELNDWLPAAEPGAGTVRAFRVGSADELPSGMSTQGRVGDWILENDRARFVIEDVDRTMSPCPFGGNVIDGVYIAPNGDTTEETFGEICPMLNLGQTFRAQSFEILEDGSEGRAVLAATGDMQTLDFLNIPAMAGGFLGGMTLELAMDPGLVRPVSITIYYALTPGTNALRVVTAFRNDGDEPQYLATGHLLRPAGQGVFYNPLNRRGGYGYESLGRDNVSATPVSFTAYTHETAAWAYVPDPDPALEGVLPIGGGSISVAGVTVSIFGSLDLVGMLLAQPAALPNVPGILSLEPGDVQARGHHVIVGDGSLATSIDTAYSVLDVPTGSVGGVVRDGGGEPVAGVRVSAVDDEGHGLNQAVSADDGTYEMELPADMQVEVRAYAPGRSGVAEELVTVAAGSTVDADVDTVDPGFVEITVTTPSGDPTVARAVVTCEGGCPRPLGAERDLSVDDVPGDFAALEPVGLDGTVRIPLEPGTYGVVISRGLEWSTWPSDAHATGGEAVTIVSGETVELDAEIAHVVDTSAAISADFHVHALASSDSSVGNVDRIWNFVSEGVDVIVSTDHDFIVDHAPTIAALELDEEIASFVGDEITTSSYGHVNAFPLAVDSEHRTGGALDWGDDIGPTLTPAETYAWAHDFPGEQVVQINHPDGAGTIGALGADLLLGISTFDSEQLGMAPQPVDPVTGDTGYWSDDFTAIEVMNGLSRGNFNGRFRYWLTMAGRGFTPTATAVTDTHKLYSDLGGVPRTFTFVSEDTDTPWTIDPDEFVQSVNAGRAIGTNGPFFRATMRNEAGDTAGLGDTIDADDGLTLDVAIDTAEWIQVDTIDLYINVREGIYSSTGVADTRAIEPTMSVPVTFAEGDLQVAETGEVEHRHWVKTVSIPLELDEDAYVVVVLRGDAAETATLWPVVPRRSEKPFAFSNPIFVDADGGGFDTLPLQDLIDSRLGGAKARVDVSVPTEMPALDGFEPYTRDWMAELLHRISCRH